MTATPSAEKRVAIVQSNYIPWKGYFDMIDRVDEFILLDCVQYTRRDWRNRNRIKGAEGTRWLTIPVKSKGRYHQRIDEVEVSDPSWPERHWAILRNAYGRGACFPHYAGALERLYSSTDESTLSAVNERFLRAICALLGIQTPIERCSDHGPADATQRLVTLCRRANAAEYLSGPAARSYLKEEQFAAAGIRVSYMDYSGYPEYPQLGGPFEHGLSILDLLFHTGPNAGRFIKPAGSADG